MKYRTDYVTNSSSSSFIITNNSDETLTAEKFVELWFSKILEDAKEDEYFIIPPGQRIYYRAGDNMQDDGAFEYFIHNIARYHPELLTGKANIEFHESYH